MARMQAMTCNSALSNCVWSIWLAVFCAACTQWFN
jgi:hypothetical protein